MIKRKRISDAEKIASGLSKLIPKNVNSKTMHSEHGKILFMFPRSALSNIADSDRCGWKDDRHSSSYCSNAHLIPHAHFPDRKFLTRYSVSCQACHSGEASAVHMYCAYCDKVLTGSMAEPGGKITDHLITIRHIYHEANALLQFLEEQGLASDDDRLQTTAYVSKLEAWCGTVRFPRRNTIRYTHFVDILRNLRLQLLRSDSHRKVSNLLENRFPCHKSSRSKKPIIPPSNITSQYILPFPYAPTLLPDFVQLGVHRPALAFIRRQNQPHRPFPS
jgi:hypothetical protein